MLKILWLCFCGQCIAILSFRLKTKFYGLGLESWHCALDLHWYGTQHCLNMLIFGNINHVSTAILSQKNQQK